jgi:putative sigma-54 modulation protein
VKLQVSGKNLDVTEAIVAYADRKLTKLTKHLPEDTRVELQFAVERNPSIADSQVVEATIWTKGPVLRAREGSADMYASLDMLADKLERQVKRYNDRRHRGRPHHAALTGSIPLPSRGDDEDEGELALAPVEGPDQPLIVKTKRFNMKPMHPQEAALQLDLVGHDFFVFTSSDTDEVAVLYRRRDGNYGLIEPVNS